MAKVVLVTGVSRYLGGLYARRLSAEPAIERILGVDVIPPRHSIGQAEFVRADIRNPMIGRIIRQAGVDTVVHMNVIATPKDTGGRVTQKEINVIGTMQLLAACQKSDSVQRLVVKSTAAVYGSSPRDPAMFTEDMNAKSTPRTGFGKDSIEVEGYVRGFSRRRPDVEITMLRFANVIGPQIRTAITDYFAMPVVPVPLGYDARVQFIHEHDAVEIARPGDDRALRGHRQRRGGRLRHPPPVPRRRPPPDLPGPDVDRRNRGQHRQAERAGGLLLGPGCLPRLRAWPGHDADAHGARLRAAVHHPGGVQGLRQHLRPCRARSRGRSPTWSAGPPVGSRDARPCLREAPPVTARNDRPEADGGRHEEGRREQDDRREDGRRKATAGKSRTSKTAASKTAARQGRPREGGGEAAEHRRRQERGGRGPTGARLAQRLRRRCGQGFRGASPTLRHTAAVGPRAGRAQCCTP